MSATSTLSNPMPSFPQCPCVTYVESMLTGRTTRQRFQNLCEQMHTEHSLECLDLHGHVLQTIPKLLGFPPQYEYLLVSKMKDFIQCLRRLDEQVSYIDLLVLAIVLRGEDISQYLLDDDKTLFVLMYMIYVHIHEPEQELSLPFAYETAFHQGLSFGDEMRLLMNIFQKYNSKIVTALQNSSDITTCIRLMTLGV